MLLRSRGSTLVAKQNCSATSFTRNGSIRAVLKPLRDGFHLIFVKPLSALGGSLCNISSNYCSLQRFSYCLKLMIFNHSTFFHTCKVLFSSFSQIKNVNIKFDIFSCFYCFAVLHNMQPILLYIFTFRQRNSKAATSASLSRPLFPFLCKLLYLFLE